MVANATGGVNTHVVGGIVCAESDVGDLSHCCIIRYSCIRIGGIIATLISRANGPTCWDVAELDSDLNNLMKSWTEGVKTLKHAKPRAKIIGEVGRVSSILRDMLNESFDMISVDSKPIYDEVKSYIKQIAPDKEKILKLYNGKSKIFEQFGIEKQLKTLFGPTVSLPGGGYIVIGVEDGTFKPKGIEESFHIDAQVWASKINKWISLMDNQN